MFFGANELLEYGKHPNYKDKKVVIIGGGNVAIDAARTIKKLGAKEVIISYRRGKEEMPAEYEEIQEAEKDGIAFLLQTKAIEIKKDKIELIKTELRKMDGEERMIPVDIPNSNFSVDLDYVVTAVGSKLNENINNEFGKNEKGYIKINENYETETPNVYAAGDCIGGKATVAWACYAGKKTADAIIERFCNT